MKTEKQPSQELGHLNLSLAASPEGRVPKYCTAIGFEKTTKGFVIMSFVHQEAGNTTDHGVLIERIMVDSEHAKKMIEALENLLK